MIKRCTALLFIVFFCLFYFSCSADDEAPCSCCTTENETMKITLEEDRVIKDYLAKNIISPNSGGEVFSAYSLLGRNEEQLFIWAYTQEFYKESGDIIQGTGRSGPLVLLVDDSGEILLITGHKEPRDGSYYAEDLKKLFPPEIQNKILGFHSSPELERIINEVDENSYQELK